MDKKDVDTKDKGISSVSKETESKGISSVSKETESHNKLEANPVPESLPESEEDKLGSVSSKIEGQPSSVSSEIEGQKKEALKVKQNKQIIWAIFLMVSMIVIIIAVPYLRDNFFNKFNYHEMEFQKTMFGKIPFYDTNLPIFSQPDTKSTGTGFIIKEIETEKKQIGTYTLSLRQDPRDLENIKVDLDINNITFIMGKKVYVTYNESDPVCEHNIISAADLARFLLNFGGMDAEGALMNKEIAEAKDILYATCEYYPDNTVIRIVAGNESIIRKVKKNCYELMYANCDIQSVTNKFILSLAEGYSNVVVKNNSSVIESDSSDLLKVNFSNQS